MVNMLEMVRIDETDIGKIYKQYNFMIQEQHFSENKETSKFSALFTEVSQQEHEKALFEKYKKGSHSGYLDDQYEMTKQFPNIPERHFRIQDDQTIIQLQNLYRNSKPINHDFKKASNQFNNRMNSLLDALDHQPAYSTFKQVGPSAENQNHFYYSIDEDYDDQKALAQAYQRVQIQILQEKVENLSLQTEPIFVKNKLKKKQKMPNQLGAQARQIKNKFARLSIQENQL